MIDLTYRKTPDGRGRLPWGGKTTPGCLVRSLPPVPWAALLCVACVIAAPAWGQFPEVSFEADLYSFDCGGIWIVDVTINEAIADLRGFSLTLEFDPQVIAPVSVSPGALVTGAPGDYFFSWLNAAAVGDSIVVDGATLGFSVSGPGAIVHLEFDGVLEGESFLRCRRGSLRDGVNGDIPFTCTEAAVDYTCPIPVTRWGWGTLKARYR